MAARSVSARAVTALVLLASLAVTGNARADNQPSPQATKEAKAHYLQGRAYQEAGAYDQAIAEYQVAFKLTPLPELIFNLAQCYRLKGDKRAALAEYKRYMTTAPEGRGAPDSRKFIAILTKEIADEDAKQAAQAQAQSEAEQKRAEADAQASADAQARAQATPAAATNSQAQPASTTSAAASTIATTPAAPAPPAGRTLRIAGLATAGAGVALLAGGIAFGLKARSASNELGDLGEGATWNQDLYDSGKAAQRNMIVLVAAGGAAVVAGGVMYFLGHRAGTREAVTVGAAPLRGGGALALTTRF